MRKIITEVLKRMSPYLSEEQLDRLEAVLSDYDEQNRHEAVNIQQQELVHSFLAAKRVERCSEKTLKYYDSTLRKAKHLQQSSCQSKNYYRGFAPLFG